MKIKSRRAGRPETVVEVRQVTVDSTRAFSYATTVVPQRHYMEVTLRVFLTDEDMADTPALRQRMLDMQHAKLLEI